QIFRSLEPVLARNDGARLPVVLDSPGSARYAALRACALLGKSPRLGRSRSRGSVVLRLRSRGSLPCTSDARLVAVRLRWRGSSPVRLQSVRPRLSLGDPPSNPRALGSTLRHTLGLSGESRPFPLSDRRSTFILRIDRRPAWVTLPHGLTL